MGDSDSSNLQPSKKRAAGIQLSRENPGLDDDDEETSELETGTFQRASEEVLATRRIVKVRRQTSTPSASDPPPVSNPFGAIRLVPPVSAPSGEGHLSVGSKETDQNSSYSKNAADAEAMAEPSADTDPLAGQVDEFKSNFDCDKEKTDIIDECNIVELVDGKVRESGNSGSGAEEVTETADAKKDAEDEKKVNENAKKDAEDEKNVNENAKKDAEDKKSEEEKGNGEVTAEKKTETASFGSFQHLSSSQNAFSGLAQTGVSSTLFTFGSVPEDMPPLGSVSASAPRSASASISMPEVPIKTGEENEEAVFASDSILYEFFDGAWKERGKGELKVNVPTAGTGKARLVMRTRGNYRLILNANLFPEMKLTNMDKKGITFACVNTATEGKEGLSTIALKFKDASIVEDFRAAVLEHKCKTTVSLKTPENSPQRTAE